MDRLNLSNIYFGVRRADSVPPVVAFDLCVVSARREVVRFPIWPLPHHRSALWNILPVIRLLCRAGGGRQPGRGFRRGNRIPVVVEVLLRRSRLEGSALLLYNIRIRQLLESVVACPLAQEQVCRSRYEANPPRIAPTTPKSRASRRVPSLRFIAAFPVRQTCPLSFPARLIASE